MGEDAIKEGNREYLEMSLNLGLGLIAIFYIISMMNKMHSYMMFSFIDMIFI